MQNIGLLNFCLLEVCLQVIQVRILGAVDLGVAVIKDFQVRLQNVPLCEFFQELLMQ